MRETGTKVARLYELFGGVIKLAAELGVTKSVVSRWNSHGPRGGHGLVPSHYNARIMDRARALGIDAAAVAACLDAHLCPCCKRPLEPGARVNWHHARAATGGR